NAHNDFRKPLNDRIRHRTLRLYYSNPCSTKPRGTPKLVPEADHGRDAGGTERLKHHALAVIRLRKGTPLESAPYRVNCQGLNSKMAVASGPDRARCSSTMFLADVLPEAHRP